MKSRELVEVLEEEFLKDPIWSWQKKDALAKLLGVKHA
jgi:hypothetical protein